MPEPYEKTMDQPGGAPSASRRDHPGEEFHQDIIYPSAIPFVLVHLACLGAIWTGVPVGALVLCLGLYLVRMFAVTAGYHRYFAHRTYKTSRLGQFLLAFLCQTSTQKGVIWWAAIHRHHHKHSDTELDVHSPRHHGFLYSHVGWIFSERNDRPSYDGMKDLTAYPELVWLDRYSQVPSVVLAAICLLALGWPGLVVGFFWSTVLLYHGTFAINSLAHVHGKQRYVTGDDSRNNFWLALVTLGEGWHNNHHAYQSAARQGFRWWEIDLTYYGLKLLSWVGIVRDLRDPPEEVVRNERRLGRRVIEQVARQIAHGFPTERIAERVHEAWEEARSHLPSLEELRNRAGDAQAHLEEFLRSVHLPALPSPDELRERIRARFDQVPAVSVDEVSERAREILLRAISVRLLERAGATA